MSGKNLSRFQGMIPWRKLTSYLYKRKPTEPSSRNCSQSFKKYTTPTRKWNMQPLITFVLELFGKSTFCSLKIETSFSKLFGLSTFCCRINSFDVKNKIRKRTQPIFSIIKDISKLDHWAITYEKRNRIREIQNYKRSNISAYLGYNVYIRKI